MLRCGPPAGLTAIDIPWGLRFSVSPVVWTQSSHQRSSDPTSNLGTKIPQAGPRWPSLVSHQHDLRHKPCVSVLSLSYLLKQLAHGPQEGHSFSQWGPSRAGSTVRPPCPGAAGQLSDSGWEGPQARSSSSTQTRAPFWVPGVGPLWPESLGQQIGRASCRERG